MTELELLEQEAGYWKNLSMLDQPPIDLPDIEQEDSDEMGASKPETSMPGMREVGLLHANH